jgi:transcription-repair coupling factor (superfamily II helicase)
MPVTIGYLNRFRTAKQKAETIKDLAEKTRYRYWNPSIGQ